MSLNRHKEMHELSWQNKKRVFGDSARDLALAKHIEFKAGAKALDLACGDGMVSEFLVQKGLNVTSIDFSDEGISQTKERVKGKAEIIQTDITKKLPLENETFDYVFWLDNVEHLLDPTSVILEIRRILKPGGKLIVTLPNMGYWFYRLYYVLKGNVIGTDGSREDGHINQPWEWEHIRFFNQHFIKKFLKHFKFNIINVKGYNYRPYFRPFVFLYPRIMSHGFLIESEK